MKPNFKHLILTSLIDNRINLLKGIIKTCTFCSENNIEVKHNKKLIEEFEYEKNVLEKQRQVVYDNISLFNVK